MMTTDRPFRWHRVAGMLHAISNTDYFDAFPDDEIETLCGLTARLTRIDCSRRLAKLPNGAPAPTCRACHRRWCEIEGIPP